MLRQPVRTQHLSTNGADELAISAVSSAEEIEKSFRGAARRNYCRHRLIRFPDMYADKLTASHLFQRRDDERAGGMRIQLTIHVYEATFRSR